ncbi:MAG: hypothetical protein ACOC5T_01695 [Elusimicrobiota bacterium]
MISMKTLRSSRPAYRIVRGDTFEEQLELVDNEGEKITDEWTWRFTVRKTLPDTDVTDDTDEDVLISKSGTFTNGEDTLEVSPEDTDIEPGEYYFDYQLKKPNGSVYSTFYGDFIVEYDITRTQES